MLPQVKSPSPMLKRIFRKVNAWAGISSGPATIPTTESVPLRRVEARLRVSGINHVNQLELRLNI